MTSTHFDSRNLLVIWDDAGESLTESVYKNILSGAGCQKWSLYTLLIYLDSLAAVRVSPIRTLCIISVLEYLIFALGSALFILFSFLAHDMEGSALKSENQEANLQVFELLHPLLKTHDAGCE